MNNSVNSTDPPPSPKGWFERNWKWAVPVLVLGSLTVLAVSLGGIVMIILGSMKSAAVSVEAVKRARENPEVVHALGQPIRVGWWVSGSISVTGPSGNADLAIPLSGPRGSATLYLRAEKRAGVWHFDLLEVAVEGMSKRISLLSAEEKPVSKNRMRFLQPCKSVARFWGILGS